MSDSVTITRGYFDTLLRRAELCASNSSAILKPTVSIPQEEYDSLLEVLRQYSALRQALLSGGIGEETLKILIDSGTQPGTKEGRDRKIVTNRDNLPSSESCNGFTNATDDISSGFQNTLPALPSSYPYPRPEKHTSKNAQWDQHPIAATSPHIVDHGGHFFDSHTDGELGLAHIPAPPPRDFIEQRRIGRHEQRTLRLTNIADSTKLADIVQIVRGGPLADIWIKRSTKCAHVSFVDEADAWAFHNHSRRRDIYIHGKRLGIDWNNSQHNLSQYVITKIGSGATRNIVIRNAPREVSEARLRTDLEHIHNLTFVSVQVDGSDLYLSLNSIATAMFARTCMISRSLFKGVKVEFYPDECALPLPEVQVPSHFEPPIPKIKRNPGWTNRFEQLSLEDTEDEASTIELENYDSASSPDIGT